MLSNELYLEIQDIRKNVVALANKLKIYAYICYVTPTEIDITVNNVATTVASITMTKNYHCYINSRES